MYKEILKQYKHLNYEIYKINKRLDKLRKNEERKHDFVKGSSSTIPYQEVHYHIEGYPINNDRIKRLENILEKRLSQVESVRLEIEEWIANIPDSRTRQVFEMRYIENRSWVYISRKFGSCNESYARKLHDRFLENI